MSEFLHPTSELPTSVRLEFSDFGKLGWVREGFGRFGKGSEGFGKGSGRVREI
jgi:hypothetical protein